MPHVQKVRVSDLLCRKSSLVDDATPAMPTWGVLELSFQSETTNCHGQDASEI